ncbi:ESX secretion-associated protein EspG [Actinokineospora sp. PR83]|uniref:ESX secretion-associated protein EspG n=1 Tax=Actinokineospora sp. PR83 TaxID=2884908 RepID=UPI001F1C3B84|nr:ESX secretion-associated protein EspG [Actinokineospora sp. PR83]MCG8915026.1 ESX secretion-associated protein EspG [Actinokineospora sp. PR83]
MELRTRAGVALHPVEVDLLCTFAEVAAPFPLDLPSAAASREERDVLFHGAAVTLIERDLADERGPLGVAEEFVYLLRACTGVLDLVVDREDLGRLGVAVLVAKDEALLVTQDEAEPFGVVRMHAASVDEAVSRLAHLVPRAEAPRTAPFTLPKRALRSAFEVMLTRLPDDPDDPDADVEPRPMTQDELDTLLREHGIDETVARRMVASLQPVVGSGQAGLAHRDETEDQWHRTGEELRWVDTPRGRYRLATEDPDWMSVNPLGVDELRAELRSLAARAR